MSLVKNQKNKSLGVEIDEKKYRFLFRKKLVIFALAFILPFSLLLIFIHIELHNFAKESLSLRLKSIAQAKAQTLDLFLRERVANLTNIVDEPSFFANLNEKSIENYLARLRNYCEAFVDLALFDSTGIQKNYVGTYTNLSYVEHSNGNWFRSLIQSKERYIITDIFLSFRNYPYFAIAVKKIQNGKLYIIRSTLESTKIWDYLLSTPIQSDELLTLINPDGKFQVSNPSLGSALEQSPFSPPQNPKFGILTAEIGNKKHTYGYSWLTQTNWCVIVCSQTSISLFATNFQKTSLVVSVIAILLIFILIYFKAKKIVDYEREKEILEKEKNITRSQLEHASKLATLGELLADIAHEINNTLAITASEIGLIKDLLNPKFKQNVTFDDLIPHLDNIQKSTFRASDITKKILTFVRKDEMKLDYHDVNQIVNELLEGFLEHELYVSNIKLEKILSQNLPKVLVDANSLKQVILNLINNARDAITPPGTITITTWQRADNVFVSVKDTGCGISKEHLEKVFLPFFTTKPIGKGTGLGLSVSYNIVKSFGGKIEVESQIGKGSTFTIVLPIKEKNSLETL